MDVELYIYDLSKGLARTIDAIYHTSLVVDGVEYYFGQGIQTAVPGRTHHGAPMERLHLGKTEIPTDVIEEFLQSLVEIYTPESYDLFLHNCNNFTQDLAMFLVGKGIPEKIRNLPQTFLNTPFGQMLKPQIESTLRGVTQAPGTGLQPSGAAISRAPTATPNQAISQGIVQVVTNLSQLEGRLSAAAQSCAVIFFTSATCPPCKMVYPTYDELAEEAGDRAVLIKVDISTAMDVSMKYNVRATPTFMTFVKGSKLDEWSGANPAQLRGNVRLLLEMAYPEHPHRKLRLPSLQRHIPSYILYKKVPPLDKLVQKLRPYHEDPTLRSILDFLKRSADEGSADVALPANLPSFTTYLQTTAQSLPRGSLFALVDLVRLLFLDPRMSGYYAAEDTSHTLLLTVFGLATTELDSCPYNLRIVMLHLACNLFSTPLYPDHVLNSSSSSSSSSSRLRETLLQLVTGCLLDSHSNLRVVAASLAYNLAAHNHNARFSGQQPDRLTEEEQMELTASLVEAIGQEEESPDALHGLVLALGLLVYEAPVEGSVVDLCKAMGIAETVRAKKDVKGLSREMLDLLKEVGEELLGKGL
ncbi:hypothetical protein FE257_003284 [Aspergillus nanangensis]|uniref:Thioredoxin n=1 Tax=Aspergillus nanangensis TaxID=2582783 RepID=A0AAD4CSU7_ASPNN|nr:hypothetical protein FE257_003284 [Aspergillus nanangensis]